MAKSKKNKNKAKLNLTVRGEQRNKLEQMASLVEILSFAF
jgi:hypothetical protein